MGFPGNWQTGHIMIVFWEWDFGGPLMPFCHFEWQLFAGFHLDCRIFGFQGYHRAGEVDLNKAS